MGAVATQWFLKMKVCPSMECWGYEYHVGVAHVQKYPYLIHEQVKYHQSISSCQLVDSFLYYGSWSVIIIKPGTGTTIIPPIISSHGLSLINVKSGTIIIPPSSQHFTTNQDGHFPWRKSPYCTPFLPPLASDSLAMTSGHKNFNKAKSSPRLFCGVNEWTELDEAPRNLRWVKLGVFVGGLIKVDKPRFDEDCSWFWNSLDS